MTSIDETQQVVLDDDELDVNIYRGGPSSPGTARPPSPASTKLSTVSSSSSSSSSAGAGRLGAIAAIVESAITRWARGRSSSSSTSSSSSIKSSRPTISDPPSPKVRLRRRRSVDSQSGIDIAARISLVRAREVYRQTQRQFILYLPPYLVSTLPHVAEYEEPGVIRSTSLPQVMHHLGSALKRATKGKWTQQKRRMSSGAIPPSRMTPKDHLGLRTGITTIAAPARRSSSFRQSQRKPRAWFLDVASPTWEDMREIGKFLHLHPLTLEDVLQRDPREKLEVFPKLGYYFISLRAIESQKTRDRRWAKESRESVDGFVEDAGTVLESNVYLVVFEKGICAFHFTDISEHLDHVRNRIKALQDTINMTSDWIAYAILDSIIDSFFPFLKEVEKEAITIEDLVLLNDDPTTSAFSPPISPSETVVPQLNQPSGVNEKTSSVQLNEKVSTLPTIGTGQSNLQKKSQTRFSLPPLTLPLILRRIKRGFSRRWRKRFPKRHRVPSMHERHRKRNTLVSRMARTRRLVTSLTRVLSTKSEVIAQVRKRLMASSATGRNGERGNANVRNFDLPVKNTAAIPRRMSLKASEDADLSIYIDDVQDHVLTLQFALNQYESLLSKSHLTYLSQLSTASISSNNQLDTALFKLSTVIVGCTCVQVLCGICSMNVTVPHNERDPTGRYNGFGIVVTLSMLIITCYLLVVRHWWTTGMKYRSKVA